MNCLKANIKLECYRPLKAPARLSLSFTRLRKDNICSSYHRDCVSLVEKYTSYLINVRPARTDGNITLILQRFAGSRGRHSGFDVDEEIHYPTRPVDKEKAEHELVVNIKKATSPEESAPKQKHVRSELGMECTCP